VPDPIYLAGRHLRSTCLALLHTYGPTQLRELHALLHLHGYALAHATPIKALADAMGTSTRKGHAERVERGVYRVSPGFRPRRGRHGHPDTLNPAPAPAWPAPTPPEGDPLIDQDERNSPGQWIDLPGFSDPTDQLDLLDQLDQLDPADPEDDGNRTDDVVANDAPSAALASDEVDEVGDGHEVVELMVVELDAEAPLEHAGDLDEVHAVRVEGLAQLRVRRDQLDPHVEHRRGLGLEHLEDLLIHARPLVGCTRSRSR